MKKIFLIINFIFIFSLFSFTDSKAYITKKSGDILCVSKSFNANYRLSKWKCTDDEREIPKGTAEYNEGLEFLKISDSLTIMIPKRIPTKSHHKGHEVMLV